MSWNCWICTKNQKILVTLHVSVWVEIVPQPHSVMLVASRSTWACELKLPFFNALEIVTSHAPRERVSWNDPYLYQIADEMRHAPRERVSWNNDCRQIFNQRVRSRSTWACELKWWLSKRIPDRICVTLHVSVWVEIVRVSLYALSRYVTLHVSVWVEMLFQIFRAQGTSVTLHVSVWVEILFFVSVTRLFLGHAPRERVSWNI